MKQVVITGVSTGIGHASAKVLLDRGCRVFGSVRTMEDARRLQAELGTRFVPLLFDVTDELAAYRLASLPFPGVFGVFYETDRPTKNSLEKKWIENTRDKVGNASDLEVLQKTFDRMK